MFTRTSTIPLGLLIAGAIAIAPTGCTSVRVGGSEGVDKVLDSLRAENQQLTRRVAQLESELQEHRVKAQAASSPGFAAASIPPQTLALLPVASSIEIDSRSAFRPASDGGPAAYEVLVKPLDGRRRFVQGVGVMRATVTPGTNAAHEEAKGTRWATGMADAPAVELAPEQLREAYRSGFLGTYYLLRIPVTAAVAPPSPVTITVSFDDALTGQHHQTSRSLPPASAQRLARERPSAEPRP
jgi:outer membrane murein-binding lipoprotein Lpp